MLNKRTNRMGWPMLNKCCGCFPLQIGCVVLCIASTMMCITNLAAGAWNLPQHREREPEDNLISMSMVMFSTLSTISNILTLVGIRLRRPGYVQLSLLCNSVFTLCIFLVAVVTCLFSIEHKYLRNPLNIALVVMLLLLGAAYSLYYLMVVNSLYRKMKMEYGDESAIPL